MYSEQGQILFVASWADLRRGSSGQLGIQHLLGLCVLFYGACEEWGGLRLKQGKAVSADTKVQ